MVRFEAFLRLLRPEDDRGLLEEVEDRLWRFEVVGGSWPGRVHSSLEEDMAGGGVTGVKVSQTMENVQLFSLRTTNLKG